MPQETIFRFKTVSVTKALAAASAYDAGDVLSEHASTGTAWTFSAIAMQNGASGEITKVHAISQTTALTPRLAMYFYTTAPTSQLNDHAANTALLYADEANYIGRVDFVAMSENGTGASEAIATESTYGNLPLAFTCAAAADDIYGILVTMDVFTQVATKDMVVKVTVKQA